MCSPEGGDGDDPSGNVLPCGWRSCCTHTMQPPRTICREITPPSFHNHPVTSRGSACSLFLPLCHTHRLSIHTEAGIQMQASHPYRKSRGTPCYSSHSAPQERATSCNCVPHMPFPKAVPAPYKATFYSFSVYKTQLHLLIRLGSSGKAQTRGCKTHWFYDTAPGSKYPERLHRKEQVAGELQHIRLFSSLL